MTAPSGQPFQPVDPAQPPQPTASETPATPVTPMTPEPRDADRTYAVGAQQLGRVVHELLTTGATFTLDGEDPSTGTVTFHDYNGARFTLTMFPSGDGTQTRLSAEGDQGGRRAAEFYAALDPRVPAPVPSVPSSPADRPASGGPCPVSGSHAARSRQGRHGASATATPDATDAPNRRKLSWLTVIAVVFAAFFLIGSFNGITTWSTLLTLTAISAALSALAVYITRKDAKGKGRMLAWAAAGLTAVALVVGCVNVVRAGVQKKADEQAFQESMKVTCGDYTWPTSDLVAQLPQPQSATGEIHVESSSSFSIAVCDTDASGYDAYVKALQEKGFTVDYSKTDTAFNGKNEAGYSVHVDINEYNDDVMDIAIYPPSTATADGTDDTSSTGSGSASGTDSGDNASDSGAQSDQTQSTPSDGSSSGTSESDFKAAMDSYEKTMNSYVDFMNKYDSQGRPVSMLADYTKLMVQYNDAIKKFEAVDEGTLTPEEQQYYIEVQTRVNQKLATLQ